MPSTPNGKGINFISTLKFDGIQFFVIWIPHGSKMTSLFANFAQGLATLSFSSVIDHYVKQRGSWGYAINYMS
jgi:hypothetical protein